MRVIGMISGTSVDAIEAAAVELRLEGRSLHARLVKHVSVPYEAPLRARVLATLPPRGTSMDEVAQLDTLIGQAFAEVAQSLADDAFAGVVDVVCSHGQTVYHWVEGSRALGTLQIGQPAWVAERTGATVVGDTRARDVAAGGHGAPFASLIDVLLLGRHPDTARAALNLGGIANATIVGPAHDPVAFDIGPANALLDAAVHQATDGREAFDEDGRHAARGAVDERLLDRLLDEPYYRLAPPKSTGKELFHLDYVKDRLGGREVALDDLAATLSALTAETVARALRGYGVDRVYASGGGTRNPVLMRELTSRLEDVAIQPFDVLGLPEAAKEAVLFALIGFLSVNSLPGTIASCTGARHDSVLGAIVPGRQAILAAPATPTRLVMEDSGQ